ncbi:hypothetical protein HF313_00315 [Massilia atriviolacea]|uniref:Uncharacterized protein n=1 Tax=Massilia atriviolacea TaxID=2495579 RepID=A0A430HKZ4_9BURK|nr:hypothetical protein [Massilia atriviolacea]RSZ58184.1 hypothetical protein EJB06_14545 [Massilia atriviolacea]
MFSSTMVPQRMGVSLEKMDFALHLPFIGFQSMKETGLTWPLITEAVSGFVKARKYYGTCARF